MTLVGEGVVSLVQQEFFRTDENFSETRRLGKFLAQFFRPANMRFWPGKNKLLQNFNFFDTANMSLMLVAGRACRCYCCPTALSCSARSQPPKIAPSAAAEARRRRALRAPRCRRECASSNNCAWGTLAHHAAQSRTAPHSAAPRRTAPHRTAPHRTAQHSTAQHSTAQHQHTSTAQHS